MKKQSGDKAASVAGRLLKKYAALPAHWSVVVKVRDVRTLAGSVLSQDETKGPRRRKRARK